MLKISICFIIAAIFFVISICSEVVLINKFESIIAIIVPLMLGGVSAFFVSLGCFNYDKYTINNIKNTINTSYPNAEIISNINSQIYPDVRKEDLRAVEFCWYDCSEAPLYYDVNEEEWL